MSAKALLLYIFLAFTLVNVFLYCNTIKVNGDTHALYGSYGVLKTEFQTVNEKLPKVFFIGNSVYYGTSLLPELNLLQASQSFQFEIGNFGFTGASIYDYQFTYNHVKQFKPDLLVVQLAPISFGSGGPHFRNDSRKGLFKSSQIEMTKKEYIRTLFDKDDISEALCYSFLPVVMESKLLSSDMNNKLRLYFRKYTSLKLWSFFPNKLNIAGEWATNRNKKFKTRDVPERIKLEESQYETAKEAFINFKEQLIRDNQKTLFLIQPNDYYRLPIMDEIKDLVKGNDLFTFDDHRKFYNKMHYSDKIHPNKKGAIIAARKHYFFIKSILSK